KVGTRGQRVRVLFTEGTLGSRSAVVPVGDSGSVKARSQQSVARCVQERMAVRAPEEVACDGYQSVGVGDEGRDPDSCRVIVFGPQLQDGVGDCVGDCGGILGDGFAGGTGGECVNAYGTVAVKGCMCDQAVAVKCAQD